MEEENGKNKMEIWKFQMVFEDADYIFTYLLLLRLLLKLACLERSTTACSYVL